MAGAITSSSLFLGAVNALGETINQLVSSVGCGKLNLNPAAIGAAALAGVAGGKGAQLLVVVGLSVMFGSALAMVWISFQAGFAEIPKTTWENGLLAWVASLSWVGVKVFEAITSGAIQRWIRVSGIIFSAVMSLLVLAGLFDTLQMWLDSFSAASLAVCAINSVALVAMLARWRFPAASANRAQ